MSFRRVCVIYGTKLTTIVFIFAMASVAFMAGLPGVNALNIQTTAYISVSPNPIGVNQTLTVIVWLVPSIPANATYHNYTVKFTKPDGTIVTIGPFNSTNLQDLEPLLMYQIKTAHGITSLATVEEI